MISSSGVYRAYVYGPGGGQMLAMQSYDGQFYWAHTDHLGSGRKLTNTSGAVVYRGEFDPHGQVLLEVVSGGGQTFTNSHKFTGYERDWATNLDNAKARTYNHNRGRFMQPDPLGLGAADLSDPQSLNRYSYVQNDPVNFVDPSGLAPYLPGAADGMPPGFWGGGWNFNDRPRAGARILIEGEARNFPWTGVRIPGFEGQHLPFLSMFAGYSLWGGYQGNNRTDCQRFADMVEQIANQATGVDDFLDRMARTFTAANDSSYSEMIRASNTTLPAGRPTFGSSGFKQQFREADPTNNQIRHFVGGFIAGAKLGYLPALVEMNSRERGPNSDPDIALNGESTWMGRNYSTYPGSKAHDAYGGFKELAKAIRKGICE